MLHNTASDRGLHCLQLIQQLLDTSTGSQMDLFKFKNKYDKELRCPNIQSKYGNDDFLVVTDSFDSLA